MSERSFDVAISGWPLTLEQFLALPEAKPALEYGPGGEVTQKVSPTTDHSALQGELVARINAHAVPRRLGRAYPELRVTLGGLSRVPDVAVYVQARRPRAQYPTSAPDLVVEIASPNQSRELLDETCAWFVTQGVRLALLVEPSERRVRVFRAGEESVSLEGSQVLPLSDVLPGLAVRVAEVFTALD